MTTICVPFDGYAKATGKQCDMHIERLIALIKADSGVCAHTPPSTDKKAMQVACLVGSNHTFATVVASTRA